MDTTRKSTFRISIVCLIVPTISAAILGLTSPPGLINKCETDECKAERLETAALILKYRNETTQPCDNIFHHVCGNYEKSDLTHNFDYVDSMRNIMKDKMIEKEMELTDELIDYKLVHDFYTVCMDDKAREKALETVKKNVEALGGWPIVEGDKWKEADFNWMDLIRNSKKVGFDVNLLNWVPKKMVDDQKSYLAFNLKIAPDHFSEKINPNTPFNLAIYSEYISKIVESFADVEEKASEDIADIVEFEYALYNITDNYDDPKNMTVEELQKEFPSIDWTKFIEKTLTPFLDAGDKPILMVDNPKALKQFLDLMEKTPKNVLANYGIWKIIQFSMLYMEESLPYTIYEFQDLLKGPEPPREVYCGKMTSQYMDQAVERMYLDHFESSKETIGNMFSAIKEAMIEMIKESKLSEDDKKQGVELLTAMEFTIGGSDKLSDLQELENYYQDAEVQMDNFLQTVLNMKIFKMKKENSNKLRADEFKFSPEKPPMAGLPENFKNHLYIPITMIPSLMFDNNLPMYMNFGAAGSHMAHEMFKSVAHLGKKFGEDGKQIPNDQYKCFVGMGDKISIPELKEAFEEAIVDDIISHYIGFQAAFRAYQRYVAETRPELPLAEVPYTVEQLFWISWAQSFCYINGEDYPPLKPVEGSNLNIVDYMTMLAVNNVPQISESFKCPVGSMMNPEKKCTWW